MSPCRHSKRAHRQSRISLVESPLSLIIDHHFFQALLVILRLVEQMWLPAAYDGDGDEGNDEDHPRRR